MIALPREMPDEMAVRLVAEREGISGAAVFNMVEMLLSAVVFPPLAPFLIAGAILQYPLDKLDIRLKRGYRDIPEHWLTNVEARASDDGRFFVGRALKTAGKVSLGDALKFVAIEKTADKREQYAIEGMEPEAAKVALIAYYDENRTIFDKAMTLAGDAIGSTLSGAADAGVAAARAIHQKLRVGF